MATSNRSIMQKADMEVSDLIADGGYLQEEQAQAFIVDAIKQSVMLKEITVKPMKSHTAILSKVGFSGSVLHPGTSGQAVTLADRTKPVTDDVTLSTHLFKGEIRLNDETLEDNIENGTFKQTVMDMMAEAVAYDMENVVCNGDTTSTDPLLAVFNGMRAKATSHPIAGGTLPIHMGMFELALKAMPQQYAKFAQDQAFYTSNLAEIDYRTYLASRATVLGDKFVEGGQPMRFGDRPIKAVPAWPNNLEMTADCTSAVLTHPKNAICGIWRKVKVETDRDIQTGQWIMVVTVRFGFEYQEEDAVVQINAIKVA